MLKFTPSAWSAIEDLLNGLDTPTRDRLDVTGLLRRLLAASAFPISTFATEGQWGEIDNPEDVALYRQMVSEGDLQLEDVLNEESSDHEARRFTGLAGDYAELPRLRAPGRTAILGYLGFETESIDAVDVGAATGIWTRMLAARGLRSVIAG